MLLLVLTTDFISRLFLSFTVIVSALISCSHIVESEGRRQRGTFWVHLSRLERISSQCFVANILFYESYFRCHNTIWRIKYTYIKFISTISVQLDDLDRRVSTLEFVYEFARESAYVANLLIIGTLARLLPHCGLSMGKPHLIHYRNVGYNSASAYAGLFKWHSASV